MASTYSLSGISFFLDLAGTPIFDYEAELVVTAPTRGAYFEYTVTGGIDGYFDFYGNAAKVEISASGLFNDFDITLTRDNAAVARVPWSGGETDMLFMLLPFGTTYVTAIFPLGGASLAHVDSTSELLPFLQGFENVTLIDDGPFVPDQRIFLSDVALLTETPLPKPAGLVLSGDSSDDVLVGDAGDDRLSGFAGQDTLEGDDGADTLNGGDGNDIILGGATEDDQRDVVYAGAGDDFVDGGYGNDLLFGMGGNDTLAGGFGADELQGQDGNDVITGSAFSDLIFGGAGDDFINGGFGFDRLNGGSGADKFFHVGVEGHGSDWIQDYIAAQGDVLLFGGSGATADDFQVNFTHTESASGERSGDDDVQEAFVIYKPTGQILWALVDGEGQDQINLQIGGDVFDLLG